MISFWRQMRFIMWKSVVVKKRQKAWLAVEILVPIILFAIVALVRLVDFTLVYPTCHYNSRALPSAGLLPFANGFLCSFTNKCQTGPTTGDENRTIGIPEQTSIVVDGVRAITRQLELIGQHPSELATAAAIFGQIIHRLAATQQKGIDRYSSVYQIFGGSASNATKLFEGSPYNFAPEFATSLASAKINPVFFVYAVSYGQKYIGMDQFDLMFAASDPIDFFCNHTQFDKSFALASGYSPTDGDRKALCGLMLMDLQDVMSAKNLSSLSPVIEPYLLNLTTSQEAFALVDSLSKLMKDSPLPDFYSSRIAGRSISELLNQTICNQATDAVTSQLPTTSTSGTRTAFDELKDYVLAYVMEVTPGVDPSSKTDKDCSGIPIIPINCSLIPPPLLPTFGPLLYGRILVTPPSPVAEIIVEKLNKPLRYISYLLALIPELEEVALPLQDAIAASDLPAASKHFMKLLREYLGADAPPWLDEVETTVGHLLNNSSDDASFGRLMQLYAKQAGNLSKCFHPERFFMVKSEAQLERTAVCLQRHEQYLTSIVFTNVIDSMTALPDLITYKIRHTSKMTDGTSSNQYDSGGNQRSRDNPLLDLKYLTYGWSFLQEAIDRALIGIVTNSSFDEDIGVYVQQEPFPCSTKDPFTVQQFLGIFVLMSWMIPSALLVKNIVYEKEQRLKELMRIMGLGDTIHFVSWALVAFILNLVSILIICSILKFADIMPTVDFSLLFVFLVLWSLSAIAQSLFISTLFTNANIATALSTVIFFLSAYPFQLSIRSSSETFSKISLILPQTAMCYGMTMIGFFSTSDLSTWEHIDEMYLPAFKISFTQVLIGLAVDIVLYWILAWYTSAIHPGVHGVSQPLHFPFRKHYWFPRRAAIADSFTSLTETEPMSDEFEREPTGARMTVHMNRLDKVYSNGMKALDCLELRLYEGQITGLLGHNGAGKTTTMSMLCGLFSPSSGTAIIYGADIRTEMRAVRDSLGVCPQHNVLFHQLTVYEQLYFYAALKGVAGDNLKNEVRDIIDSVGLQEKEDSLSGKLSGGQKRRLCIGIALIGGSRFVILDEPTAGVDVNSRKDIWRLLMRSKQDRTILLSTHHMDEADMLSDRIAILSKGKLAALGSAVFLKNRFGDHTTLTCLKATRKTEYSGVVASICALHEDVHVRLADETEEELTFHIPISTDSAKLEEFFGRLDDVMVRLNIGDYGISAPTLQETFVALAPQKTLTLTKITSVPLFKRFMRYLSGKGFGRPTIEVAVTPQTPDETERPIMTPATQEASDEVIDAATPLKTRIAVGRHIRALLAARWHYTARSRLALLFEIVFPILLLCLMELYVKLLTNIDITTPRYVVQPPLNMITGIYGNNSDTYLSLWDRSNDSTAVRLLDSLFELPGMSVACMNSAPRVPEEQTCAGVMERVQTALPARQPKLLVDEACDILNKMISETLVTSKDRPPIYTSALSKANKIRTPCCTNDTSLACIHGHRDPAVDYGDDHMLQTMINANYSGVPYNEDVGTCGVDETQQWNCTQGDYKWDDIDWQQSDTTDYFYDMSFRNLSQFRLVTTYATWAGNLRKASYALPQRLKAQNDPEVRDSVEKDKERRKPVVTLTDFTGGIAVGHVNPFAPSDEAIADERTGWRALRAAIEDIAPAIGLDASSIPPPRDISNDTAFHAGITLDSFVDAVLGSMEKKDVVKLWFNNKRWASLPIYTGALSNMMLRAAVRAGNETDKEQRAEHIGILTYSHPMNNTVEDSFDTASVQKQLLFRVVLLLLVMCTIPAGFSVFLVEDRTSHSFHLQIVSGLSRRVYWATSFLFDLFIFALSVVAIMLLYLAMNVREFTYSTEIFFSFLLLLMVYGMAEILLVYLLQKLFAIAAVAFVMISIGTFFLGVLCTLVVTLLESLLKDNPSLEVANAVCSIVFLILPQYNLGMAISRGSLAYQAVAVGESYFRQVHREDLVGTIPVMDLLRWNLMGKHIVALAVQFVILAIVHSIQEHGSLGFARRWEQLRTSLMLSKVEACQDEDVLEEKERVKKIDSGSAGTSEDYGLVVKDLAKAFDRTNLTVRGVSFAVERGECFGLLGLNGAGKTTTFGMMTGKNDIGHGEVRILGEKVSSRDVFGYRHLGYCPQFDALHMKLTTRENCNFYARIRGISEKTIPGMVDSLLRSLHLFQYADIVTSSLSGGNKRKLSVAVALVSQPPVIMLDEPSAGMDPGSQQFLWTVIGKLRRSGRAVVLTSHSMEECEALCTRIAILDAGRIRCIGSKQHLKNKFGEGFSLTMKFSSVAEAERSQSFMAEHIPHSKLVAIHCTAAFYRIPVDLASVTEILRAVNKIKLEFAVEDFSLSQTTLDEIFQAFSSTASNSRTSSNTDCPTAMFGFGLTPDFDVIEEVDTIRGNELRAFIIIYIILVALIVVLYECIMPVLNHDSYPFYNHIPDYSYRPKFGLPPNRLIA